MRVKAIKLGNNFIRLELNMLCVSKGMKLLTQKLASFLL